MWESMRFYNTTKTYSNIDIKPNHIGNGVKILIGGLIDSSVGMTVSTDTSLAIAEIE